MKPVQKILADWQRKMGIKPNDYLKLRRFGFPMAMTRRKMMERKCNTCIHRKAEGCEKWECEYKERTPNRTETREFKLEFLRMASYIDCLLECSDTQKETLMKFISRLSEYIPWYEDDDFEVDEHTPERTETHACVNQYCIQNGGDTCDRVRCPIGHKHEGNPVVIKAEAHGDVISRQAAIDALESRKDKTAKGDIGGFYNAIIQNDIDKLRNLPSAEPERKTGRWIEEKCYDTGFWTCSKCKFTSEASGANILYKFCPNCGAKMEESCSDSCPIQY